MDKHLDCANLFSDYSKQGFDNYRKQVFTVNLC